MGEWGQEANMPAGFKTYNVATEALNKAKADMDASGEHLTSHLYCMQDMMNQVFGKNLVK